jgi:hypothetical protein
VGRRRILGDCCGPSAPKSLPKRRLSAAYEPLKSRVRWRLVAAKAASRARHLPEGHRLALPRPQALSWEMRPAGARRQRGWCWWGSQRPAGAQHLHQRGGNRRQRRLRNPLMQGWQVVTSLRPVHSSACNATDTVLSRCNLGGSRVRVSDWRMRSFGPLYRTLPEVPRAHAITFGAFVAIHQVGPTRRVGQSRHIGGCDRTSG